MPIPYSLDLRWQIIWIALTWHASPQDTGQQLIVSERTVRRYLKMFEDTGDVKLRSRRSGPLNSSIRQLRAADAAKADS